MLRRSNRVSPSGADPSVSPLADVPTPAPVAPAAQGRARPLERLVAAARNGVGTWAGGLGIRARLMILVLGLAAPFMLYIVAMAWSQAQGQRADAMERAESTAQVIATRIDDFVGDTDQMLRLIANAARDRDGAAMQSYLQGLRGDVPEYVNNIGVWSAQGERIASLEARFTTLGFSIADRGYFREVLRTGDLAVEAPVKSRATGDPVVLFARPVTNAQGRTVAVITASARLRELDRILDATRALPSEAVVTLLDRQGIVVARSREPDKWIGRNMTHMFDLERFRRPTGSSEVVGFDGVHRISGYATPTRAPWKVYVGVPTASALARVDAQVQATMVLGGIALVLGLLFAIVAGNGIALRLRRLADDAVRLEAGQLDHRSVVRGGDEVGVLGNALNRMAEALEQRNRALEQTTEDLKQVTANVPVLISYIDAQQRYRFANEFHRDVFGIAPERLIGHRLRDLFPAEAYARLAPRIAEVLSGFPASFETSFNAGDAAPYFLVSCFPDYADDHAVRGFYAVCQDITRRRQAEEALAARERFTQLITDTIPARITYLDTEGRIQFGNARFAETWGATGVDFAGLLLSDVVPPAVYTQIAPHLARGLAGETLHYELSLERNGHPQHDIVRYVPDFDDDGRVQGLFTISQDVTALKRLESARADSEKRVRLIADNVPAAMAYLNRHERYLFANAAFMATFDTSFEDLIGKRAADILPAEVYATTQPHIESVLNGERQRFQRVMSRKGTCRHELVEYIPEVDGSGDVTGFFALIQNITDLHDAQARVEASEQRLRRITDNIPALVCYIDRGRRYRFNSRYYEEWLGRPMSEITGRTVLEVLGPETCAVDEPYMERAFAGERVDFEMEHTDARGTRYVRGSYVPDYDSHGEVIGIYGATTDVTSHKQFEKELARMAQYDSLTGLPNRNQFDERITAALQRMRRSGLGVGLLFLDIDGFKGINDSRGHGGGDAVLREFARRLSASVRETDTVARLAGDDFVVILEGVHKRDECLYIARKIVAAMQPAFAVNGGDLVVTTSIGIAMTTDSAMSADALLQRADGALYSAKAQGRNRFEVAH
jgi:diguanylate cyclase (GGDEF)-like protein/PAS domain S-box-containing protein